MTMKTEAQEIIGNYTKVHTCSVASIISCAEVEMSPPTPFCQIQALPVGQNFDADSSFTN